MRKCAAIILLLAMQSGCATTRAGATMEELGGVVIGGVGSVGLLALTVSCNNVQDPSRPACNAPTFPVAIGSCVVGVIAGGVLFFHGLYTDIDLNGKPSR
jgi:hypothetical protein